MRRDQKLTKVIAGRTIKAVTTEPGGVLVLFDDQSSMKIKIAGAAAVSAGSKVKSVHEAPWPTRALPLRYGTRTMLSNVSGKSS